MTSAYGDYVFYARPCEMKEGVDWAEEGEVRYQPCCYNTVTDEETVLMRSSGFNCSVYPLCFCAAEGETKLFTWVTAHGNKEWILSRDSAVLYVDVPEFGEGFFIRYGVFSK